MTTQTRLATVARAVAAAPIVSPTNDILKHRSTIVFIVGFLVLMALPYAPDITPERLSLMTNVTIVIAGILGGRFTYEGIQKARADLKPAVDDVLALIKEAIGQTAPIDVTARPAPLNG